MPVGLSNKRIRGPGTDPSAPPSLLGPSRACSPLNAARVLAELSSNWMLCSVVERTLLGQEIAPESGRNLTSI